MSPVSEARLDSLRSEVRAYVAKQRDTGLFTPTVDGWLSGWDERFSQELAAQGWIGMTIPVEYGGQGRSHVERFVVTEELLAAGAPVAAHWVADRQIAPSLLRYGTDEQRRRLLPEIARGERFFAIGMSEPDSGSDLASVRTRATRVDGGWRLEGTKVWTSNAHRAHAFFVLARTSPRSDADRHGGLTQFIVDLRGLGVSVRPIQSIDGHHHFNEVVLDGVFVSDADVLGEVGEGWRQVTSELSYERSGPERFLSTFPALARYVGSLEPTMPPDAALGAAVARIAGLHHLSWAVAKRLEDGKSADLQASMVKVMGTLTEGDVADYVAERVADSPVGVDPQLRELTALSLLRRPGFTLRGGTNEILRGLIANRLVAEHDR